MDKCIICKFSITGNKVNHGELLFHRVCWEGMWEAMTKIVEEDERVKINMITEDEAAEIASSLFENEEYFD